MFLMKSSFVFRPIFTHPLFPTPTLPSHDHGSPPSSCISELYPVLFQEFVVLVY